MNQPITIVATALVLGLGLTACEDDPEPVAVDPAPALPGAGESEVLGAEAAPAEEMQPAAPTLVEPAVAILSVEVDCAATSVFFATDSAALEAEAQEALDSLAACLKGTPEAQQVEVTGRADPRGTEAYNEKLSRERAAAVADYLRQQGVEDASFEIRARGESGVVEGMPVLWPLQRQAEVEVQEIGGPAPGAQQNQNQQNQQR